MTAALGRVDPVTPQAAVALAPQGWASAALAVAEAMPHLAWITGPDGAITWYNRRWYDFTGSTPAEMLGDGWRAAHHPALVAGVVERFRAAIDAEASWEDTFLLRGRDGGFRWFLSRAEPVRDEAGALLGWFGTNTDVHEQRRNADRFRAAVDAIQGTLWTNDAEGRMAGPQPGWQALTGQPPADYAGYGWADAVHPDDAQASVDEWRACVAERRTFVFEHRVRRADGRWGDFAVRAVPVMEVDGGIREWVV